MVKGETIMPTPTGDITSTELWTGPAPEVAEEVVEEEVKETKAKKK